MPKQDQLKNRLEQLFSSEIYSKEDGNGPSFRAKRKLAVQAAPACEFEGFDSPTPSASLDLLDVAARELDITLIPAYTNLYLQFRQEDARNHFDFFQYKFMGASLAATAHAFSRRFGEVSISPDYDIPNFHPNGSHPLLEPNYSSVDLRIRYDGTDLSRFERTKLVVDWGLPLPYLRVCNKYTLYEQDRFNCCRCEKCVRTILALLALGILGESRAFPVHDVSEEILNNISITRQPFFYKELIDPLKRCGREDLALLLEKKIQKKVAPSGILKTRIKQLDERFLRLLQF